MLGANLKRCAACGGFNGRHAETCRLRPVTRSNVQALEDVARANVERGVDDVARNLRALALVGEVTPADRQLLAAIDRWRAGDLA